MCFWRFLGWISNDDASFMDTQAQSGWLLSNRLKALDHGDEWSAPTIVHLGIKTLLQLPFLLKDFDSFVSLFKFKVFAQSIYFWIGFNITFKNIPLVVDLLTLAFSYSFKYWTKFGAKFGSHSYTFCICVWSVFLCTNKCIPWIGSYGNFIVFWRKEH